MCKTHNCQSCGVSFDEKPSYANKYCSRECYVEGRFGSRPWAACSGCLAAVGFGKRITGQILGVKPGTVLSQRKRDGIETQTPPMGSWYRWAMRKAAGKNPDRKRTDCEIAYELHHMDDVKLAHADGFTWVTIWEREAKRRYAKARYDAMTTEEKALKQEIQTRRIKAKMEANPELKAKKAADQKNGERQTRTR